MQIVCSTHIDFLILVQPVSKFFPCELNQVKFRVVMDFVSKVLTSYQSPVNNDGKQKQK